MIKDIQFEYVRDETWSLKYEQSKLKGDKRNIVFRKLIQMLIIDYVYNILIRNYDEIWGGPNVEERALEVLATHQHKIDDLMRRMKTMISNKQLNEGLTERMKEMSANYELTPVEINLRLKYHSERKRLLDQLKYSPPRENEQCCICYEGLVDQCVSCVQCLEGRICVGCYDKLPDQSQCPTCKKNFFEKEGKRKKQKTV